MTNSPKLNVLQFICPTGFYGAERWILALARHLPRDRFNCDLAITLESEDQNLELVKQYQQLNLGETHQIPMSNRFDLKVVNRLVDLIHAKGIDIIHTHGYKSDILGVIAAKKAGIKSVVTPHGFENARDFKLRLFIWMGCKAMSYADRVAPLSPQLMEDSRRVGVKEGRLHYIQNGVDLTEVEAQKQKAPLVKDKQRIGFIGQLISRKNVTDILDIFASLYQDNKQIELVILGDGDQRTELERYASQLEANPAIQFLGFRDDRLELLQSFDLFVMTSTLEGIPRCLMEACAMEIPVAAYNIPGIDQLITHEETGLLAKPGDKEALMGYWKRLLEDRNDAGNLAQNACQYVNQHYSAQRMADEYRDLFESMLNG